MRTRLLTVTSRNLLGNILVGAAYLVLGAMKLASIGGRIEALWLALTLALTTLSLVANVTSMREREDEMSRFNSGRASNLALWTTLTAVSLACIVGILTGASINLMTACYLIDGFALSIYGAAFATLERRGHSC